jgi:hypothetical protein
LSRPHCAVAKPGESVWWLRATGGIAADQAVATFSRDDDAWRGSRPLSLRASKKIFDDQDQPTVGFNQQILTPAPENLAFHQLLGGAVDQPVD